MKILYLGLRPKPGTIHYPVIYTEKCPIEEETFSAYSQCTHMVFTSRTSVLYWPGPWDKKCIAISDETAKELLKKKVDPLIAPFGTQEGVIELIFGLNGFFFLPQSQRARPDLVQFLKKQNIPFYAFTLYQTHFQKIEPVPDLKEFDEIIFTSPSTVEGFLRIFGSFPVTRLKAIGPVTQRALKEKGAEVYSDLEKGD